MILTPQESVAAAAAGQLSLDFSEAVDADRRAALCHMEVFGQSPEVVAGRARQQQQGKEPVSLFCDLCLVNWLVWCCN